LGVAWQEHASLHCEDLCDDMIFLGNISGQGCQGDLEQVLGVHRSLSLNYILKLDLWFNNFVTIVGLPYDSILPCEESFFKFHLLELHIRQGYVHDLQKLKVLFVIIIRIQKLSNIRINEFELN
jgi:hypothetical protein